MLQFSQAQIRQSRGSRSFPFEILSDRILSYPKRRPRSQTVVPVPAVTSLTTDEMLRTLMEQVASLQKGLPTLDTNGPTAVIVNTGPSQRSLSPSANWITSGQGKDPIAKSPSIAHQNLAAFLTHWVAQLTPARLTGSFLRFFRN